jgi:hypothetical protein
MTFTTLTQKLAIATGAIAAASFVAAAPAQAAVIGQWNFNSVTPDTLTSTGSLLPSTGAGTLTLVGGTTSTFATSAATSTAAGSSDPATDDDTGLNTATYPAATAANKTAGVRFKVSTAGFENVIVSFDQRLSNTAANLSAIQYTTDGINYTGLPEQLLSATTGETWLSFSSGILGAAANDNANFGFQILAAFNTTAYVPVNSASYGTSGTRRFDMVTVNGDAVTPVPTPALLPALIGFGASIVRKRKQQETV